ncbi:phenylalanine 4-monooxygenase [Streptomyces sp. NBC_00289]|uniref:phenylalanine 4-monooxygenase n=1 Tax=Streptomyces sp. NBC_00289 TaxID=2975703 RepID=UPI003247F6AB
MFEEAQYFAPVSQTVGGVVVELAQSDPGFGDPVYRARRNDIAALTLGHAREQPVPVVEYTALEDALWAHVSKELSPKHQKYAVEEFLQGTERLGLPAHRIPQLQEVSEALEPLTGFRYLPAAGLVPLREFYEVLADGYFHSTQYIRHISMPFYTPEPDVIHEVIGHANMLASDRFARLYRLAGEAARRVQTQSALEFISKIFWFTLEFGVMKESGELRAYGAGILSSCGEIEKFRTMHIRPLDLRAMGTFQYDITKYQELLFCADSVEHLENVVGTFWAECDDDSIARLEAA